jgi:hypothetical protein
MLAVATVVLFGMLVIGCGKSGNPTGGGGGTQSGELDGTWYSAEDEMILSLNNGVYEMSAVEGAILDEIVVDNAFKMIKGNYTTSGNRFTMTPTQVHGDMFNAFFMVDIMDELGDMDLLDSRWYTRSELKSAIEALVGSSIYSAMGGDSIIDEEFNEMATQIVGTYVLSNDILIITFDGADEPTMFTRL